MRPEGRAEHPDMGTMMLAPCLLTLDDVATHLACSAPTIKRRIADELQHTLREP